MTTDLHAQFQSAGASIDVQGELRWQAISEEAKSLEARTPLCVWLERHCVIDIVGAEAATFLQNQLSNDVNALKDGTAQWQGYTQPQGRLLAAFPLIRASAEHFWMMVPKDIAVALHKRLSMFVLRTKAKLSISEDAVLGSIYGTFDGGVALTAARQIKRLPLSDAETTLPALIKSFTFVSTNAWDLQAIREGIIDIRLSAQDKFIPQMLGWDKHAVNFKKGCYPGQEVVSRAHYRGAVKRKLTRIAGEGSMPLPGDELEVEGTGGVGHVALAARTSETGWVALSNMLPEIRDTDAAVFVRFGPCRVTKLDQD
jgi:tRNA-modifying protein YgfZ